MEMNIFCRKLNELDDSSSYLVSGVIRSSEIKSNHIQKIGYSSQRLSFVEYNSFSLESKTDLDSERILTSGLEVFLDKPIWDSMLFDGFQILCRETSLKDIFMFVGIAFLPNDGLLSDNSIYYSKNGSIEIIEYKYNIIPSDNLEIVLLKNTWWLNNKTFKIISVYDNLVTNKLNIRHIAKAKEILNIELDISEIEIVELFDNNYNYNKLLYYSNSNFVKFLVELYKKGELNKNINAIYI